MKYQSFYLIRNVIIEKENIKDNAYLRSLKYCKDNGIDRSEIVELFNDNELAFYRCLIAKGYQVKTHVKTELFKSFKNFIGDEIPSITIDIPFVYIDENGDTNYAFLISSLYDIDNNLILVKKLFDKEHRDDNYLRLVWLNNKGEYIDWKLGDYTMIAKEFRTNEHKIILAKQRAIRERQKYDRLLKLRSDGKITDNQRKELYKLEAIYGDVKT